MPLALFDLDETLIHGDSATMWLRHSVAKGWAPATALDREEQLMQDYRTGTLDMKAYIRHCAGHLEGLPMDEVARRAHEFAEECIRPIVYPQAWERLRWHEESGDTVIIISATSDFLVRPIAAMLGVDNVIAIRLAEDAGCFTTQTVGTLSFREGKVARLHDWIMTERRSLSGSIFYSDSHNDMPLLDAVDVPIPTNPDDALRRYARHRGWRVLDWKRAAA